MAAREFLRITKESSYGTKKASPTAGVDVIVIRLAEGNSFTMRPKPRMTRVMYGGGLAIPALTVAGETGVAGTLQTKLCYSQALFLLNWGFTRINAGQTSPWTTTEPVGDLASVTIDHAIQRSDGTYKRKSYPGCKVAKPKIEGSREAQIVGLNYDVIAQKVVGNTFDASTDPDATAFPAPAETDYPLDVVMFQHSAAGLKIDNGGTARTGYESFSVEADNKLDARAYESRWLQFCRFLGRESKLMAKLALKASPDDRAAYEILTAQAVSLALTNGVNTITLDYKGNNVLDDVADDLPLDKLYEQGLTIFNQFEQSSATDLAFTYA